jgi:hypothetical protein
LILRLFDNAFAAALIIQRQVVGGYLNDELEKEVEGSGLNHF